MFSGVRTGISSYSLKKPGCRYRNLQPNNIIIVYSPKNIKMKLILLTKNRHITQKLHEIFVKSANCFKHKNLLIYSHKRKVILPT